MTLRKLGAELLNTYSGETGQFLGAANSKLAVTYHDAGKIELWVLCHKEVDYHDAGTIELCLLCH